MLEDSNPKSTAIHITVDLGMVKLVKYGMVKFNSMFMRLNSTKSRLKLNWETVVRSSISNLAKHEQHCREAATAGKSDSPKYRLREAK